MSSAKAPSGPHGDTAEPDFRCQVCGHAWFRRSARVPKNCPKCGSAYWQVGRQRPPRTEALKKAAERKRAELASYLQTQPELLQRFRPKPGIYRFAGAISASNWREKVDGDGTDYTVTDIDLLDWRKDDDFLFVVDGDCLTGEGVFNGDLVHIRVGLEPEMDDIVCATGLDTMGRFFATLKLWHPIKGGIVELRPSNPAYSAIRAHRRDVEVQGVAVSSVRRNLRARKKKK